MKFQSSYSAVELEKQAGPFYRLGADPTLCERQTSRRNKRAARVFYSLVRLSPKVGTTPSLPIL